jgi:hypothetical protein
MTKETPIHPTNADAADPVGVALNHLQTAEHDLEQAHELERKAEEELHRAEEELREAEQKDHDKVEVHVTHVNEVETAKFKASLQATLQAVWDEAYVKLGLSKQPKDIFQTAGNHPTSLMSHLGLTLAQAREQGLIKNYHFEIVSETGGA